MLRLFFEINERLSAAFDRRILPSWYSVDGNRDFVENFAPRFLRPDMRLYDIGSGKRPYLSVVIKNRLNIHVTGLDIDQAELLRAPEGAYDATIVADICAYRGNGDADVVICQALLEHVRDNEMAFQALARLLKPEGVMLIFVPSRNAIFARLNMILPEPLKKWILFFVFPKARYAQGFPSYYDRCTPREFIELAARYGLTLKTGRYYFKSSYFSFFFPLYFLWRMWILLFRTLRGTQAAETFSMAFRRTPESVCVSHGSPATL